jgi:hypothetical protein
MCHASSLRNDDPAPCGNVHDLTARLCGACESAIGGPVRELWTIERETPWENL